MLPPNFPRPDRPSAAARAVIVVFLLACLALFGRPVIFSDGTVYYALSESLARDFDFDLANQSYLEAYEWRAVRDFRPYGGRMASIYSGGIAVMNFPFLFPIARLHDGFAFLDGLDAFGESLQHVPLAYSIAILAASFVYLALAALLTFDVVRRWVSDGWAAGVTLAVMCALPAVMMGVWEPSYSHTADAFLVALALWLTARLAEERVSGVGSQASGEEESGSPAPGSRNPAPDCGVPPVVLNRCHSSPSGRAWPRAWGLLILLGATLGLATFVRVMNVVLFVPWGVYLAAHFRVRGEGFLRISGRAALFALGAAPFAAIVLWYNAVSYGAPFRTAYHLETGNMAIHHSPAMTAWLYVKNVGLRLFSPRVGAFVWAPLCLLAVAGLLLPGFRRRTSGDGRGRKRPQPEVESHHGESSPGRIRGMLSHDSVVSLRSLRWLCLGGFVAFVLVMGVWNVRGNRGHGAGPRFFIESFPFLAVGLAALVGRVRGRLGRLGLAAGIVLLVLYSAAFQAARVSYRSQHRVNALLARTHGPGYEAEWSACTPFQLLRAVVDDSMVPPNEPTRGMPLPRKVLLGAQPSVGNLLFLAAIDRLPVTVAQLRLDPTTAMADPARLRFRCVFDRPVHPGMQLAFDVFEHRPGGGRRGRRWGRFVSADLPTDPPLTEIVIEVEGRAGLVRMFGGGRDVPLPGYRLEDYHAQVLAEATHLDLHAVLRRTPPSILDRGRPLVIPNPWFRPAPEENHLQAARDPQNERFTTETQRTRRRTEAEP